MFRGVSFTVTLLSLTSAGWVRYLVFGVDLVIGVAVARLLWLGGKVMGSLYARRRNTRSYPPPDEQLAVGALCGEEHTSIDAAGSVF
jgi:hypothetical protein